ncbi:MAG: hypothetical protein ABWZ42_01555 [Ilumatobacteraceae bacterium]
MTSPRFLPWLRRGLSNGIGDVDADPTAALPLRSAIKTIVELADSRGVAASASVEHELVGPADVIGIDGAQVVRLVPPADAVDVEANYFPLAELVAPDLPWLLTPARATPNRQRLRPWLTLVCVEEREGIEYDATARPLGVLRLSGADAELELPDLAESWAWAHVQSMVSTAEIDSAVSSGSGAVIARFLCPRQLAAGRRYRAALVPAFDVARDAGLGLDVSQYTTAAPAWGSGAMPAVVELPVYVTWTFTTSAEAGDFEELARRLEPDLDGGRMGYHGARVVDTGLLEPLLGVPYFEYEGPLVDAQSQSVGLMPPAGAWFRDGMRTVLERTADRAEVPRVAPAGYDPAIDDPIVGPPLYGSWAVDEYTVRSGWLDELNLEPRRRAAAGLGAKLVRDNQHDFLAAAWDQAGDVRALQEELNRGRLAAEVGRSHARRLGALSDEALLQATGRQHVFVPSGTTTAASRLRGSAITPIALTTPAFARQTRSGALLSRRAGTDRHQPTVGVRTTAQFVAASVVNATRGDNFQMVARFGAAFVGDNTITADTEFELLVFDAAPGGSTAVVAVEHAPTILSTSADDVTAIASTVRSSLDPMTAIVAGLDGRLTGVSLDASIDLPTRVPVGPRFIDPLFPKLHALGSEVVLPGIDVFGNNRVRLVEVNEAWIAAFLAGANHHWARVALWNEYPADLGATSFSHFWPRVPAIPDLAEDMHEWRPLSTSLADHVGGEGSSTVLLVRGDVIRRYPDTQFMLVTPAADGSVVDDDGNLPPERTTWPAFAGQLDAETVFVGFDVDSHEVLDDGMYVGIEQPVTGPLFGLDSAADATKTDYGVRPQSWRDLSWSHMAASERALAALSHVSLATATWLDAEVDDLEWPRNSAHLAGITFQQPFRLLLPAAYLMPGAP